MPQCHMYKWFKNMSKAASGVILESAVEGDLGLVFAEGITSLHTSALRPQLSNSILSYRSSCVPESATMATPTKLPKSIAQRLLTASFLSFSSISFSAHFNCEHEHK